MSLVCTALEVRRGGRTVITDVSLTLPRGKLHAVVGPNGAGKSSLLGALARELPIAAGRIDLDHRVLTEWPRVELARTRALLGQRPEVPFAVAVWELVSLGRLPHRATVAEDDAVVQSCLEALDLMPFAERDTRTLSGGELQRVHLARALAQITTAPSNLDDGAAKTAGWLLLDEPTAALDLGRADAILALLRQRCRAPDAEVGVVAVVHDLGLALRHADTVTLLHEGRCVASGPPALVLQPERVAAVWGTPVQALRDANGAVVALVPERTSE